MQAEVNQLLITTIYKLNKCLEGMKEMKRGVAKCGLLAHIKYFPCIKM